MDDSWDNSQRLHSTGLLCEIKFGKINYGCQSNDSKYELWVTLNLKKAVDMEGGEITQKMAQLTFVKSKYIITSGAVCRQQLAAAPASL